MDKELSGEKPGLLWVNSKLTKPDQIDPQTYQRWYEQVHIPDIFKTSGIKEAYRYQSIDPEDERPYLALYPLKDLDFLDTDEFKAIPVHDDSIPGSHAIFDFAEFDTRYYKQVQLYEPQSPKTEAPNLVISAGFTPADDEDYNKWYNQEHLLEVSGITGWRRTERYELSFARSNRKPSSKELVDSKPKFLTLHFFDGETPPADELAKAGESEWTKKTMSAMEHVEVAVFKKLGHFKA